jgi:spore germination cell wall hydrolase CwlJ-like protein
MIQVIPTALLIRNMMKINFLNILKTILFVFLILIPSLLSVPQKGREHGGIVSYESFLQERECIKEALWFEARGESELGQRAVLNVIRNRMHARTFPSTYCKVIEQPRQFSYRLGLKPGQRKQIRLVNALDHETYAQVSTLADEALLGAFKPVLEPSVLWYTHIKVKNKWTKCMKVIKIEGNHHFLKEI